MLQGPTTAFKSIAGVATGLLGIPNRYMHTPSEVIDCDDLDAAIQLLAGFLENIHPEENWIP